jgi:hypothetical protein
MVVDIMLQPVPLIVKAIEERRMIRLMYDDKERILQPHDQEILNGSVQLLGWQTAGCSSRPIRNWLLIKTNEISELRFLDETFPGDVQLTKANTLNGMCFSSELNQPLNLCDLAASKTSSRTQKRQLRPDCRR